MLNSQNELKMFYQMIWSVNSRRIANCPLAIERTEFPSMNKLPFLMFPEIFSTEINMLFEYVTGVSISIRVNLSSHAKSKTTLRERAREAKKRTKWTKKKWNANNRNDPYSNYGTLLQQNHSIRMLCMHDTPQSTWHK